MGRAECSQRWSLSSCEQLQLEGDTVSPAMGGTGDPSGTGSVQRTGKLGSPSLCPMDDKGHSDLGGTTMVMWVTPKHYLGAGRTLATRLSQCQGPIATSGWSCATFLQSHPSPVPISILPQHF